MGSSVEDTTIRPAASATRVGSAIPATLHLTILWHPEPSRVGQIAALDTRLSRLEPEFGNAPLEVAHVSRTPAVFRRVSGG